MTAAGSEYELVYAVALEAIACGLSRWETDRAIGERYSNTSRAVARIAEQEALVDALKQGVEREDIDRSWFRVSA